MNLEPEWTATRVVPARAMARPEEDLDVVSRTWLAVLVLRRAVDLSGAPGQSRALSEIELDLLREVQDVVFVPPSVPAVRSPGNRTPSHRVYQDMKLDDLGKTVLGTVGILAMTIVAFALQTPLGGR